MKRNLIIMLFACVAAFTSCKKEEHGPKMYKGSAETVGNGSAYTSVTLNESGLPTAISINLSEDALNGLPTDSKPHMFMLNLPSQASKTGYDHCELDWNPHGHDPLFAYGVPHFDFHFYMITPEEQSQVKAGPDHTPVDKKYIPSDYMSGVIAVPNMGVHWVDSTAPEFTGGKFTATFIYGFYHGKMTFLEPMVTKAFLETHPDFTLQIKQPQAFQRHCYYPTKMHISYDSQNKEYKVTLENLIYH